jgi:iron(III) transport system substrate-binding protein
MSGEWAAAPAKVGLSMKLIAAPACAIAMLMGLMASASAQADDAAALATYQGADREQRLLAGAKAEGGLTLYSSMQLASIKPLQEAFERRYGIKIAVWRGSGKDILTRVLTEAQANRADLDVLETDGFALEALHREGVLQTVKSPYTADLIPEAVRPHGQWVGTRVNISASVYNTQVVKKETLPKSYHDLLDPRFKGMLGVERDDYDWFGMVVGLLGEEKGLRLFRQIVAANGLSVRKGHTLLTNLAAAGEVPIGLDVFMQNVDVAKKRGAPIDWFLIQPAVARFNAVATAKRAPHPHAALLFYDFMLSEGQTVMLKREFVPSSRKIPSVLNRVTLHFVDPATVLDGERKWQKLYDEVVRSGGR